jgi:ribosomal protein S12 methylthiotransferase accessory factor
MTDLHSKAGLTFNEDVETLLTALRRIGIESVVVADLTREDIGIPVAKVIVPGLEGLGAGEFSGERLREAERRTAASTESRQAS